MNDAPNVRAENAIMMLIYINTIMQFEVVLKS
jgi:hypothetical protein